MARIIYNDIIPFKGFQAITIWPFVFARNAAKYLKDHVVNHEGIHLRQQLEVLAVSAAVMALLCLTCLSWWWMCEAPFTYFIWYCLEYVVRLCAYGDGHKAYRNVAFEQEAFLNERNFSYLSEERKAFAWARYLTRKTYGS